MRINTKIAAGGCILAFVFGLAWFAHRSGRNDDAALVRLVRDNVTLDFSVRFTERESAAANRDCAELLEALNALPSHPISSLGALVGTPKRNLAALLAAYPKLAALDAKAFRASLAVEFRPLYRSLKLTPEQIVKFESLMAGHQEEVMDTVTTASSQGLGSDDATIVAVLLQENEEFRTSQMALLGDAGYQQLQQFIRAMPMQGIVHDVADAVALSSSPLTGQEADQLSRILANSNSRFQNGRSADPAAINWSLVLTQAQSVLSKPQFNALQGQYQTTLFAPILAEFRQEENKGQ